LTVLAWWKGELKGDARAASLARLADPSGVSGNFRGAWNYYCLLLSNSSLIMGERDDQLLLFVIQHARNTFFQNTNTMNSFIESEFQLKERIQNYVEDTVENYPPNQFRENFRLSRSSFDYVLDKIEPFLEKVYTSGRHVLDAKTTFLCALYILSNNTPFR